MLAALGGTTALGSILFLVLPGIIARGAYGFPFRGLSDLAMALLVGLAAESLMYQERDAESRFFDGVVNLVTIGIGTILTVIFVAAYGILLVQGTNPPGSTGEVIRNRLDAVM